MPVTWMVAVADPTPPSLSVARTRIVRSPSGTLTHVALYGGAVTVFSSTPSPKNSTFAIVPSGSVAVAVIGTSAGAVMLALLAGDVMFTIGSAFAATVIVTISGESPVALPSSFARA